MDDVEKAAQAINKMQLPGKSRCQIEAKAVYMHLRDPVTETVHDKHEDIWKEGIESVACAGVVVVVAFVPSDPVIIGIVYPTKGKGRAHVIAFTGVVIDNVQDDLDARLMKGLHHILKFIDLAARLSATAVSDIRGKKADGIVSPIVGKVFLFQVPIGNKMVYRHQLYRGYPELFQIGNRHGMSDGGISPPDVLWNMGVKMGKPLDMGLIDDRVVIGDLWRMVVLPVVVLIDNDGFRRKGGAVRGGHNKVVSRGQIVTEQRVIPFNRAGDRLCIGIDHHLVGVKPVPIGRLVRAMDPIAVQLTGFDSRQVGMPDLVRFFVQLYSICFALPHRLIKKAKLD